MKKIMVKNVCFGDHIPKICVPIVGRSRDEILKQAELIKNESEKLATKYKDHEACKLSVIEFRADYFDEVTNTNSLRHLLKELREIFPDKLLLFTYRSEEEGGELRHDRAENMIADIQESAICSGCIDMIDVELMFGNYHVARIAASAHDSNIATIVSYHNFEETPHDDKLETYLWNMEYLGGDILKIAVKPQNKLDVDRMIDLTIRAVNGKLWENNIENPVAIISMGELGKITRINGNETGSCLTFAYVGEGSAPGQIALKDLYKKFSEIQL